MLFSATVRISSGPAFVKVVLAELGARAGFPGVPVAAVILVVIGLAGRILGLSTARTVGSMTESLGRPALLTYARSCTNDKRIEAGYATIFAFGIVLRIILVLVALLF